MTPIQAWSGRTARLRWPGRARPQTPVVFTHVPKAAGTAFVQALEGALTPRRALVGFDESLFGSFREFDAFTPEERTRVLLDDRDYPKDADFIAGHFSYSTTRRIYPEADHIIALREPVSRLMSHWIYWRAQADERLDALGAWGDIVRLARGPFEDFLGRREIACQIDNASVRALLHGHPLMPDDDFIAPRTDARLLRAARAVLRDYAFADILEDDAMLDRLSVFLGAAIDLKPLNETPPVPDALRTGLGEALTPKAAGALRRLSRLDRQLWTDLARRHMSRAQISALRMQTRQRTMARHATLLMPAA